MLGAGDYINIGHYASPRAFAALCNVQSGREGEQDEDGGGGREGGEPKLTSEQEHRPAG